MTQSINSAPLEQLSHYVANRKSAAKGEYERRLAYDLSHQQWSGCFQRNVLAVLQQMYDDALTEVKSLSFSSSGLSATNGMSDLTQSVLANFRGFSDEFLLSVVEKHRTSCALSNFPTEHKPDKDYVDEVRRELALIWKDFALAVNEHFLQIQ